MAVTFTENGTNTPNGTHKEFSYTFPTLKTDGTDVRVALDGVTQATNRYTVNTGSSPTKIIFNNTNGVDSTVQESDGAPKTGVKVRVFRDTKLEDADTVTFVPGSSIRASDLNANFNQSRYALQEEQNQVVQTSNIEDGAVTTAKIKADNITSALIADDQINSEHYVADSIDTEHYAPGSVDATALASNAVTTAKILDNNVTLAKLGSGALPTDITVASANLVDGTIVNADINNSAAIAHSKLSGISGGNVLLGNSSNVPTSTTLSGDITVNNSGVTAISSGVIVDADIANTTITGGKLVNDTITATQIATNAVTVNELADNAVDRNAIVNDAVNGDKIDANSIDSDHYVDGSIDSAHIANDQINSQHYAAGSIDLEHMSADSVDSAQYVNGSIDHEHLANDIIDGDNIQNDVVNSEHIAAGALDNEHYAAGSITSDKLNAATVVTNSEQAAASANDTSFFTTSASDARYFNVSTGDTIKDGQTFPDNDTTIATTAAINDRIIDLVDDVGGFVPIANETSFPNANPDVNNGTGTIVSIGSLASNQSSNGSGVISISNGTVGNSTVTITGAANNTTYLAGYGMLLETTSTLNTYTFHRLSSKATEVTTVAGSISNVNTVAGAISNVNAVAGNASNINSAVSNASNINSAVSNASNINSAVSNASNINSAVSNASNINTTAGSISNVNTVAGAISNVNSVASNMGTVNDFAARYRTGEDNPTSSLDTGDLFFNTSANELKVYNGSSWQGGVTASGNFASTTGNTFTGSNIHNDNIKAIFGSGSDADIYHNDTDFYIDNDKGSIKIRANVASDVGGDIHLMPHDDEYGIKIIHDAGVELYHNNTKKFETGVSGEYGSFTASNGAGGWSGMAVGSGVVFMSNGTDAGIWNDTDNEWMLKGNAGAATELQYDGTKKLETTSSGITISGGISQTGYIDIDSDSSKLRLGDGQDLEIYHNGTSNFIKYANGNLIFKNGTESDANCTQFDGNGDFYVPDNGIVYFGGSADLKLYHNGTNNYIDGNTNNIYIRNNVNDDDGGNIYIEAKSGETSIECADDSFVSLYYDGSKKLETTSAGAKLSGNLAINNSTQSKIVLDTSDGSDSKWLNINGGGDASQSRGGGVMFAGNEYTNNEGKIWFLAGNSGSANGTIDFSTGGSVRAILTHDGHFTIPNDSSKLKLGASNDLQIYHDGSSRIYHDGGGDLLVSTIGTGENLYVSSANHLLLRTAASEDAVYCTKNGSVGLYYDNSKKFETASWGCQVTGHLVADRLAVGDNEKLMLGNDDDIEFYSSGSHGYLVNGTGELYIKSDAVYLKATNNENYLIGTANGAVELRYDNSSKLETTSYGVFVNGTFRADVIDMQDSKKILLGNDDDLEIYHDGNHSYIKDNGTGNLIIRNGGDDAIICNTDSSVDLFHNNVKKFETTSDGARLTGVEYLSEGTIYLEKSGAKHHRIIVNDQGNDLAFQQSSSTGSNSNFTSYLRIKNGGDVWLPVDSQKLLFGASNDLQIFHDGTDNIISCQNDKNLRIVNDRAGGNESMITCDPNGPVYLYNNGSLKLTVGGDITVGQNAHVNPYGDNAQDLGGSSKRWRNIYTNDLQMSNEGSANEVDGTWGSYTIQEGEDDLFLINRRNGKKYKFNLTEVS